MTKSSYIYDFGWRQGTVFKKSLPMSGLMYSPENDRIEGRSEIHDLWIVATQDCTLARAKISNNKSCIEIRPVLDSQPPDNWGIRARKFLLDEQKGHYLVDDKPASSISPKAMKAGCADKLYTLSDERILAFKTWLGNRYDRPAVPPEYVELATSIASSVESSRPMEIGHDVREVCMEFDEADDYTFYRLYAITTSGADKTLIREWLAQACLEVPAELGVASTVEALDSTETSLNLIESTYTADLSQITWGDEPGPKGAYS